MGKNTSLKTRVNRLEAVSRPEVKFHNSQSGAFDTVGSVTGTMIEPLQLASGTARNHRIGNKIKCRNIKFQSIIKMPANPTNATCAVRVLALRCKGEAPASLDMNNWYEPVDEDKFFVLHDTLTQVSALQARTVSGTSYATGSTLKKVNFNLSMGLRKYQYDGIDEQSPENNEVIIYLLAENQSAEIAYNWTHYYIDN